MQGTEVGVQASCSREAQTVTPSDPSRQLETLLINIRDLFRCARVLAYDLLEGGRLIPWNLRTKETEAASEPRLRALQG